MAIPACSSHPKRRPCLAMLLAPRMLLAVALAVVTHAVAVFSGVCFFGARTTGPVGLLRGTMQGQSPRFGDPVSTSVAALATDERVGRNGSSLNLEKEPLQEQRLVRLPAFLAVVVAMSWRRLRSFVAHARSGPFRSIIMKMRLVQCPSEVRQELKAVRAQLLARTKAVPVPFRQKLSQMAGKLEDVPIFMIEVALLSASVAGTLKTSAEKARNLAEAISLLFAAGRLHLFHRKGASSMQLLGGDYLYAEGQWLLAEQGSLPVIKCAAQTIRDFSDNSVTDVMPDSAFDDDLDKELLASFYRTGAYFAMAADSAAWLGKSTSRETLGLHRYGRDLGCALELVRRHTDMPSEHSAVVLDIALEMATAAKKAANKMKVTGKSCSASRGLRRLATAVEAEALVVVTGVVARQGKLTEEVRADALRKLREFRFKTDKIMLRLQQSPTQDNAQYGALQPYDLGLSRSKETDAELQRLIVSGLEGLDTVTSAPRFEWPEGGPKAAMAVAMKCVAQELGGVAQRLDSGILAANTLNGMVGTEAGTMLASGGKRLRPALTLLMARALGARPDGMKQVAGLATAVEVLHSASLVHDDILDAADSRRGAETMHVRCGELPAVFVGDYLFAIASALIADLENIQAIQLIAKVIADFGRGELAQSALKYEVENYSLPDYLAKSFHKTASLLAAACQAAAVLSGEPAAQVAASGACYRFGMFVGLAFQVVDDILDFTETDETLGKPALADLMGGYVSAPVLLALKSDALAQSDKDELVSILDRKLDREGDLEQVLGLIDRAGGVDRSKQLAWSYAKLALDELQHLPASEARDALETFANYVIVRTF